MTTTEEKMKEIANAVVESVIYHVKLVAFSIYYMIIAIIPSGILPRKSIDGRVMLITGSGSGIGRLSALEFGKLGAKIVLWDINTTGNEETQALLQKNGVECYAYTVDLSQPEQIYETAEKVKREVGNVDILFNNAGVVTGKKLFESPDRLIQLTMDVNLNALFYTTKAFLPHMIEKDWGHIITLASVAGHQGVAGLVDYCASKHGAVGFHESIHRELLHLKSQVKTTCVSPYYIDTGMFKGVQKSKINNLLPILQPEYVVERIVDAVLTDRVHLYLPRFLYVAKVLNAFLPVEVSDLIFNHVGSDDTMNGFVGRGAPHAKAA
ncbi:Oxidoreductase, short chain dehydrogenase/reductase family protein [Aphelenchoides besseyi]|nr:Oxidoreductase, short chain dehydrogenase/reductase family protein [Aphelenchoides besseyi]